MYELVGNVSKEKPCYIFEMQLKKETRYEIGFCLFFLHTKCSMKCLRDMTLPQFSHGCAYLHLLFFLILQQRIVQLLHQIAQMNELLVKHHKDIISRR